MNAWCCHHMLRWARRLNKIVTNFLIANHVSKSVYLSVCPSVTLNRLEYFENNFVIIYRVFTLCRPEHHGSTPRGSIISWNSRWNRARDNAASCCYVCIVLHSHLLLCSEYKEQPEESLGVHVNMQKHASSRSFFATAQLFLYFHYWHAQLLVRGLHPPL